MKTTYIYIGLVILVVAGLVFVRNTTERQEAVSTSKYDSFAQCLTDAGAKFYGAFWCPHCQDQKALFDNSKKLPYIECSTPDRKGRLQVCIDENITGYPTWKFADGSVVEQVLELDALSEKTGCAVPQS